MLLHDRYDIERPLSAGGGGQSWLARDTRTGKRVVVKALFAPVQGDDPPAQARILQQLDHPQVQRFVEGFVEEDRMVRRLHLVTEWVEGQSLDELARSRRLEQSEVDDLIGDLLGVVGWLHGLGPPVVHRDLKPTNVIQGTDGKLVVIDFDLATEAVDRTFQHTMAAGTLGYQAPEQITGDPQPASDLYSVGVTALALWTRRDPYDLLDGQKLDWRDAARHLAPHRRAWLERGLAWEPADRFGSAQEALRALRGETPASPRPASSLSPVRQAPVVPPVPPLEAESRSASNAIGFIAMMLLVGGGLGVGAVLVTWSKPVPLEGHAPAPAPAPAPDPREACEAGDAAACLVRAEELREGGGPSLIAAGAHYGRACRLGSRDACWAIATAHGEQGWLEEDPKLAGEWWIEACSINVTNSCDVLERVTRSLDPNALAFSYVAKVEELAPSCGQIAGNEGQDLLHFQCSRAIEWLREGRVGEVHAGRAHGLALDACERGARWACHQVAGDLLEGQGVEADASAALVVYNQLCRDHGDVVACNAVSRLGHVGGDP